jgi:hypothetical protein
MELGTSDIPRLLTEKAAARILAVSLAGLRRWRREGRGPRFTRLERCVRYDLRAIEQFLAEHSSRNGKAKDSRLVARAAVHDGDPVL